jgi:Lipocalin-like domain
MMATRGLTEVAGTWALRTFEFRSRRGAVSQPFGSHPKGLLVITSDGHWSVQVMDPRRRPFSRGDLLEGTPDETYQAVRGYIAYAGTCERYGNRIVVHVTTSLFPNWVGKEQERTFHIVGDQLDLTTKPFLQAGERRTGHLIWKRI